MNPISKSLARLPLWVRVACVMLLAVATSHVFASDASASVVDGIGTVVTAMIIIPWQPALSRDQLDLMANPIQANQPEVVPWQLYDTQSIATASAAPAVFFQTINADKTMSNMEGPGQLPDPQYLIVQYVAMDWLQPSVATAVTATSQSATLENLENVLKTTRATMEFNMSNKLYGPFSLSMCHSTGGTTGSAYGVGTLAAAVSGGVFNNGVPGSGGYPFSGSLVIPPKIGFNVTVRFGAATTLVGGPINMRISLVGQLYRRVL